MVRTRIYSVSALPIESTHFCTQYPYHRLAVVTTTTTTSVYPLSSVSMTSGDFIPRHARRRNPRSRGKFRSHKIRAMRRRRRDARRAVARCVAVATCVVAPMASGALAKELPMTTLRALMDGESDDVVRRAFIGKDAAGAMVVRDISHAYVEARRRGLDALSACARRRAEDPDDAEGVESTLWRSEEWERAHDGAIRTTVAVKAKERLKMEMEAECAGLGSAGANAMRGDLESIRDGADVVALAALRRLDAAFHNATRGFYESSARSSMTLDHFHAYGAAATDEEEDNAVDLDLEGKHAHTDVGVAIVMTPALVRGEKPGAGGSRGLFIGDIEPDVPDDGMIVMLGEAARVWVPGLSAEMQALIKVPTHAMRLTGDRAWFGRMVLPESSHAHPESGMSFGTWHAGATRAAMRLGADAEDEKWAAVACPSPVYDARDFTPVDTNRRVLSSSNTCNAGEVYCWLACVEAPDACDDTAQCVDQTTGNVWDGVSHCASCGAQCPATGTKEHTGFCNTDIPPTTMYMDGFHVNAGSSAPCVALLFESWSLHTPALFALGFFATVALGASIEGLASIRRKLQNPGFCNCHSIPEPKSRVYATMIYGFQITAGYLLMLVSMTYHFALFSAVIVGLLLGHIVFGSQAPVVANTTACCSFASPNDRQDCAGCAPDASGVRPSCCAGSGEEEELPPCCAARARGEDSPTGGSSSGLERPLAGDLESGRRR